MNLVAIAAALLMLTAAPGEPLPQQSEVPSRVDSALARRLGAEFVAAEGEKIAPSGGLPGFVACGRVVEREPDSERRTERFFASFPAISPSLIATGGGLVDIYWKRYGC